MLECVMNVSEGVDRDLIAALGAAAGAELLDTHSDPHHHRTVFTMVGVDAPREVARLAVERIDLRRHQGAHPRLGVVDVVPFVPLPGSSLDDALAARNEFAGWMADELRVPCFLYGPQRALPEIRRRAWIDLAPDVVSAAANHPRAGATCVGARDVLIAYNVWLAPGVTVDQAKRVAAAVRGPAVRALAISVGARLQLSMNLIRPAEVGPAEAFDAVAAWIPTDGCELVGLLPAATLDAIDPDRWADLDLSSDRTIEARLAARPG